MWLIGLFELVWFYRKMFTFWKVVWRILHTDTKICWIFMNFSKVNRFMGFFELCFLFTKKKVLEKSISRSPMVWVTFRFMSFSKVSGLLICFRFMFSFCHERIYISRNHTAYTALRYGNLLDFYELFKGYQTYGILWTMFSFFHKKLYFSRSRMVWAALRMEIC